jgi:ERCC4-type nuclease
LRSRLDTDYLANDNQADRLFDVFLQHFLRASIPGMDRMAERPPQAARSASLFSIVVDDRERNGAVAGVLRQRPEVRLRVERLPLADYQVDETLLIERKTLIDLTQSIKDGRLFSQGLRLASSPLRPVMILEGRGNDLDRSGMRREAIQGALITLTLFFGIPLLRSMDPEESAGLILIAARQARARAIGALPRPGSRPRGKARTQSRILQALPGIGPERARRLIEHFGSIESVVQAAPRELAEVPGIGATTAKAIRWAVGEPAATYMARVTEDDWPL